MRNSGTRFNSLRTGRCLARITASVLGLRRSCFNSLRTGKGFSSTSTTNRQSEIPAFQFPPNGKGLFKNKMYNLCFLSVSVSIPYERERAFQGYSCRTSGKSCCLGFNSLRTGKGIASLMKILADHSTSLSFNSLRTGKGIASVIDVDVRYFVYRFNSLRTGKGIARAPIFDPDEPWLRIPQNHTRTARGIFLPKIYPKNPTNPDKH